MQILIKKQFSHPVLGKLKENDVINIQDNDGVPLELFWRNRIRDIEIDNAIETIEIVKTKKNKE